MSSTSHASLYKPGLNYVLGAIALAAFLIRLLPLLESGMLGGFRGYDDAVHYASGVHLIAGSLPYRDYVLVHPPGITLLMAPFAAVGLAFSDAAGVAAARILFVFIGAANTVLIGLLLKRWGYLAIIAGAGLYAVWPVATIAERSIMLSPVLNLCVLAALFVLRERDNLVPKMAVTLAAIYLGTALCFKLWAVLPILVVGTMVAVRFGPRLLLRFTLVGTGVCTVLLGPFFLLAPREMFGNIVAAQLVRTDGFSKGLMQRIVDFVGVAAPQRVLIVAAFLGILCVLAAGLAAIVGRRQPRNWGDAFWWATLALVIGGTLLASASFFDHYPNFAAPFLALSLGAAVSTGAAGVKRVIQRGECSPWKSRAPGLLAGITGGFMIVGLVQAGIAGAVLQPQALPREIAPAISAAVAPQDCVFTTYSYMGLVGDSLSRSMRHDCGSIVDVFGSRMVEAIPGHGGTGDLSVQELQLNQLRAAQSAVVQSPLADYGLAPQAVEELAENFKLAETAGNFEVWIRR